MACRCGERGSRNLAILAWGMGDAEDAAEVEFPRFKRLSGRKEAACDCGWLEFVREIESPEPYLFPDAGDLVRN